jgi:hypothetical protein
VLAARARKKPDGQGFERGREFKNSGRSKEGTEPAREKRKARCVLNAMTGREAKRTATEKI